MKNKAIKISIVTIIVNTILSIFKFLCGFFAHSGAMISDSIHSFSDVLSTFIVIAGVKISEKSNDIEHPYGHERIECVATIILSIMLALVGVGIGYSGILNIISGKSIEVPGIMALIAAIISIAVKEWMYWYTRSTAKKINSDSLMADAWHHRSDALSSIGSLIGIGGALLGYPILDSVASVIICGFILKVAISIFIESINKMIDKSCSPEIIKEIEEIIYSNNEIISLDILNTRLFGSKIFVDIEFTLDGNMSLNQAHCIADNIHDTIEERIPAVKHCMIHVNPSEKKD